LWFLPGKLDDFFIFSGFSSSLLVWGEFPTFLLFLVPIDRQHPSEIRFNYWNFPFLVHCLGVTVLRQDRKTPPSSLTPLDNFLHCVFFPFLFRFCAHNTAFVPLSLSFPAFYKFFLPLLFSLLPFLVHSHYPLPGASWVASHACPVSSLESKFFFTEGFPLLFFFYLLVVPGQ